MTTLIGLLILILDIYIIIKILGNASLGAGGKALWIVLVLIFPILGVIGYLLFGQKSA